MSKHYIVKRGQSWLAAHRDTGITEIMRDGERHRVDACVWSSRRADAMRIDNRVMAEKLAKLQGAQAVAVMELDNLIIE